MTGRLQYAFVVEDEATHAALKPLVPVVAELEKHGLSQLCIVRSTLGHVWAVLVDAGGTVAASVALFNGRPSLYVATRREDGSVVETQWLSRSTFRVIGPSAFLSDRPAKRVSSVDRRGTVATTLALHARRRENGPTELRWTADEYLAFRRDSGLLVEMNTRLRSLVAGILTGLCVGVLVGALAYVHAKPIVLVLSLAAYIVSVPLFLRRASMWAAGFVVKCTPMGVRRALFGRDADAS